MPAHAPAPTRAEGVLFEGGPPNKLQAWLGLIGEDRPRLLLRAALVILVGWLPLVVLTLAHGDLLHRVDAVVFHGGGDVDPRRYGQGAGEDSLYGIVPEHDAMELAMIAAAIEADKPVLAICRGLQVLNVALGGTLVQDIGSEAHWLHYTTVDLDAGSRIAKAMGTETPHRCHCVHHQGLDRVGDGLRIVGRHADGIIHAVELDAARWIVGIQWHPEDSAADDPQQQGLFDDLIRQAT